MHAPATARAPTVCTLVPFIVSESIVYSTFYVGIAMVVLPMIGPIYGKT